MQRETYKEIKSLLAVAPGYTQREVAKMVGMSQPAVSYVNTSKNYKQYLQTMKEKWAEQVKRKEFASYTSLPVPDWVENDNKRIITKIKGHLRDIYSLLKQIWPKNE